MALPHRQKETSKSLKRKLDPSSPVPLYHQAYVVMKTWIADGTFGDGQQLPSEADLCDLLSVSRITIKRALSELAAEGLVTRHRGRGTVVSSPKSKGLMRADFGEMMRNLLDIGKTTDIDVLEAIQSAVPDDVAEALELEPGSAAQHIVRRRLVEREPYVFTDSYIPLDIAAKFPADGAQQASLLELLIDAGHAPHEAYQRMTATAATSNVANSLGLGVGDPVLKVVRVFKTASFRPVQHTTMYFRPDRYEYTLVLPATDILG